MEVGERRLLVSDHRLGVRQIGPVIAIVELDQQLARMHRTVVARPGSRRRTGDVRRQGRHVAADIGIVGGLDKAPARSTIPAIPGDPAGGDQAEEDQGQPPVETDTPPADAAAARRSRARPAARRSRTSALIASAPGANGRCPRSASRWRTPSSALGPATIRSRRRRSPDRSPIDHHRARPQHRSRRLTSSHRAPSGAKCRLPQASSAQQHRRKSRPCRSARTRHGRVSL